MDPNDSQLEMKQSFVELNTRQMTQIEELEQLKGKLNPLSQRSRNHSSDRPGQLSFQDPKTRYRQPEATNKQQKTSQSVEKFLNLKSQNQNVENLIATWKQQRNSITLGGQPNDVCKQHSQPRELSEYETQPARTPQIVVEEDEHFDNDEENMISSQQQLKRDLLVNNVKVSGKYPHTTRPKNEALANQLSYDSRRNTAKGALNTSQPVQTNQSAQLNQVGSGTGQTQSRKGTMNGNTRPQTTKAQPVQQQPVAPAKKVQPGKGQMKQSLIDTGEKEVVPVLAAPKSTTNFVVQTPQQKKQQPSLLEKQRNTRQQQAQQKVVAAKKPAENAEERGIIAQIQKLKVQVLKCYESREMGASQSLLIKNFDQIINTMKLDFACLEDDD